MTTTPYHLEPSIQAVNTCQKGRQLALWSLLISGFGQLWIDFSLSNVISVSIVTVISAVTFHFVVRGSVFRTLPLPALVVLGFNFATMSGALIAQTLSLRPLIYNLIVPQTTFFLCALFQISLLIALYIFLNSVILRGASSTLNRRVFTRMGIMQAPIPAQLWLMGLIGCAATVWVSSKTYGGVGIEFGDATGKFITGLRYLTYAPFLIPVLDKVFPTSRISSTSKIDKWFLLGYFILVVLIAIARNSRGAFMLGISNLGLAVIILILAGQFSIMTHFRRRLAFGALVTLMLAPLMSDLAVSMVVVRNQRTEVSSSELIELTLATFNDKAALADYREVINAFTGGDEYEENYIANPFFARLIHTKFFDNTLSYSDVINGVHREKIWSTTFEKIISLLPTPILDVLNIDINKNELSFSMGDLLVSAQYGNELGGYKTGSPIAHGMGIIGFGIFFAAVPLFLLVFLPLQSLTQTSNAFIIISPVLLLQLMTLYYLAINDSLIDLPAFIFRELPQTTIIYWLVYQGTYLLTRMSGINLKLSNQRFEKIDLS